jgi:hypothetical protein
MNVPYAVELILIRNVCIFAQAFIAASLSSGKLGVLIYDIKVIKKTSLS